MTNQDAGSVELLLNTALSTTVQGLFSCLSGTPEDTSFTTDILTPPFQSHRGTEITFPVESFCSVKYKSHSKCNAPWADPSVTFQTGDLPHTPRVPPCFPTYHQSTPPQFASVSEDLPYFNTISSRSTVNGPTSISSLHDMPLLKMETVDRQDNQCFGEWLPPKTSTCSNIQTESDRWTAVGFASLKLSVNDAGLEDQISKMDAETALKTKRSLKGYLKEFDEWFLARHQRVPKRADKQPIRKLYMAYERLKNRISELSEGGPPSLRMSQTVSPGSVDRLLAEKSVLKNQLREFQTGFYNTENRNIKHRKDIDPVRHIFDKYMHIKQEIADHEARDREP